MLFKSSLRKLLQSILLKFNYKLVPNNFISWPHNDLEFYKIFNAQKKFGWKEDNGPKIHRMYKLYQLLDLIKNVKGNWAECGVFRGSTAFLLASYNKRNKALKSGSKIFLYDSFEGLAKPSDKDKGTFMTEKDYYCSEEQVRKNLKSFSVFVFNKGWIPDCFEKTKSIKFSFVHIDVDLYDAVKLSLDFFSKRIEKGGIIVLDDYGFDGTPGAKKTIDEFYHKNKERFYFWKLPYGQAVLIKN